MLPALKSRLATFAEKNSFKGKSALCVALVVTQHAQREGLPLDAESLLTESTGQVAGLGKASVQAILGQHGIERVLAEEGGRTSRGSVGKMRSYVAFLNVLNEDALIDLPAIENWWIERIREFWDAQPFRLSFDTSKSLRAIFRDLLQQVEKRQQQTPGATYVGTVIQHLVGAKLDIVLGGITHHGASEADEGTGRDADFLLGDVAIHVTTAPGEALIRKCRRNLANSIKPLIVTTAEGLVIAQVLARQAGVADRIDVLDIEQFLTCNLYEHGRFDSSGRRQMAVDLVASYNRLVSDHEREPGLHINLGV